jgi:hypothetical protein
MVTMVAPLDELAAYGAVEIRPLSSVSVQLVEIHLYGEVIRRGHFFLIVHMFYGLLAKSR